MPSKVDQNVQNLQGVCVQNFAIVQNLHRKFSEYGKNAREWMRKCVLLLPEIERNRVWEKKGFQSIYEYAAKLAGMSRETVNEALRILRAVENKPFLRRVIEEKGINAVKPVLTIATESDEKFWAGKAKELSKNTLETYVREFKEQGTLGLPRKAENDEFVDQKAILNFGKTASITMNLEKETLDKLEKLKGAKSWDELMKEFLELQKSKIERLKKEAEEKFAEHGATVGRNIPAKIKKYVIAKTNGLCAFPGCKKRHEILHHIERFSYYGEHDPEKIIPLCKAHEHLVHSRLIENERENVAEWKIRRDENALNSFTLEPDYYVDKAAMKYYSGG